MQGGEGYAFLQGFQIFLVKSCFEVVSYDPGVQAAARILKVLIYLIKLDLQVLQNKPDRE